MTVYVALDLKESAIKKAKKRGRPKNDGLVRRLDIVRSDRGKFLTKKSAVSSIKRNSDLNTKPKSSQEIHVGILPSSPLKSFQASRNLSAKSGQRSDSKRIIPDFKLKPVATPSSSADNFTKARPYISV